MNPRIPGLLLYQCTFWVLILLPFNFSAPPPLPEVLSPRIFLFQAGPEMLLVEILGSAGHGALFFPLGPLLAWGSPRPLKSLLSMKALLLVILLSVGSEVAQLTVQRGTSVSDMVMNVAGYAAGVLFVSIYWRSPRWRSSLKRVVPWTAVCGLVSLLAILLLILLPTDRLPLPTRALSSWDNTYPLVLANERTGMRPWLGRIEEVKIYTTGPHSAGVAAENPAVFYDFSTESLDLGSSGSVRQVRAQAGPPLEVPQQYTVLPHPDGGIEILEPAALSTKKPSKDLVKAIQESGGFSIHARFRPQNTSQGGPARIVTLSKNSHSRNFTLAQERDTLELRIGASLTANSRLQGVFLRTPGCLKPERTSTAVAGYGQGILSIYVDGKLQAWRSLHILSSLTYHVFGVDLSRKVELGLLFIAWTGCFAFLVILCRWKGIGASRGRWIAGTVAATLLLLILLAAALLTSPPPPHF